jgi:ribonuclease HI
MGLGPSTNNYAELMSLKLLLLFAKEKNVNSLHIFGDSLNVINWVWKSQQCHNIHLLPILEEVQRLVASFDTLVVHHVFRERNMVANQLSKEGVQMGHGQWLIIEDNRGTIYEFYHRPFIEEQCHNSASTSS